MAPQKAVSVFCGRVFHSNINIYPTIDPLLCVIFYADEHIEVAYKFADALADITQKPLLRSLKKLSTKSFSKVLQANSSGALAIFIAKLCSKEVKGLSMQQNKLFIDKTSKKSKDGHEINENLLVSEIFDCFNASQARTLINKPKIAVFLDTDSAEEDTPGIPLQRTNVQSNFDELHYNEFLDAILFIGKGKGVKKAFLDEMKLISQGASTEINTLLVNMKSQNSCDTWNPVSVSTLRKSLYLHLQFDKIPELHVESLSSVTDSELHKAVQEMNLSKVKELLNESTMNVRNKNGDTAFHIAARKMYTDIVSLFIARGASLTLKNRDGECPLYLLMNTHGKYSKIFNVASCYEHFTGREDMVNQLHDVFFMHGRKKAVISQTTTIEELGGVGKSELARQFAYSFKNCFDGNCIWINSETNGTLINSFKSVAELMEIPTVENESQRERNIKSVISDIYNQFKHCKCLMIFDNAENYKEMKYFLPDPKNRNIYLVATTRNQQFNFDGIDASQVLLLDRFTIVEAQDFIQKSLCFTTNMSDVNKLLVELKCFPLAIARAVSSIIEEYNRTKKTSQSREYKINEYLVDFKQLKSSNESSDSEIIANVFQLAMSKIEQNNVHGETALKKLNILSYIAPDAVDVGDIFKDFTYETESVLLLERYGLIDIDHGIARIHRRIQYAVRLSGEKKECENLDIVLQAINNSSIFTHVIEAWNYACKYPQLVHKFYADSSYSASKSNLLHVLACTNSYTLLNDILQVIGSSFVNDVDIYGRTPLYRAVEVDSMECVNVLLAHKADPSICSRVAHSFGAIGWNALHIAVYYDNLEITETLVKLDPSLLTAVDSGGRTPLHIAIDEGHVAIANILDRDKQGQFKIYATNGNLEEMKRILEKLTKEERKVKTNPQKKEQGPLHLAAKYGHKEVVKLLLKHDADVNCFAYDGHLAVHLAAYRGHIDVVKVLLDEAYRVNPKYDITQTDDPSGWTVLHAAANSDNTKSLSSIVDYVTLRNPEMLVKDLINTSDYKGTTLLNTAVFHGKIESINYLLSNGADLQCIDIYGSTLIVSAAIRNRFAVVKMLDEHSGQTIPFQCDPRGIFGQLQLSVLHLAAAYNNVPMARYMLEEKRLDVNVGHGETFTPLHIAVLFDSKEIVRYFLESHETRTDSIINMRNIEKIFATTQVAAMSGYGLEFVKRITQSPAMKYLKLSKITPGVINNSFDYGNSKLEVDGLGAFQKSINTWALKYVIWKCSLKKQLLEVQHYTQSKEPKDKAPTLGEDSVFYDLTNIKRTNNSNQSPGVTLFGVNPQTFLKLGAVAVIVLLSWSFLQ